MTKKELRQMIKEEMYRDGSGDIERLKEYARKNLRDLARSIENCDSPNALNEGMRLMGQAIHAMDYV